MAKIPMTKAGFEKLLRELDEHEKVLLPDIIEKVAEARSNGDLKENAEYHAARERQGQIQDKIKYLNGQITNAQIIENVGPSDTIRFGSKVCCADPDDTDDQDEYTLVGADEADPTAGFISVSSPLGQSLLGKKAGDISTVQAPAGCYEVKIISFE